MRQTTHRTVPRAVAVGTAAGFLSGLFGVGGGILIVPGLVLLLGMAQRQSHGTSLAAIIPIALSGAAGYALDGAVDWAAAGLLSIGAVGGAVVGTRLLGRLPERGLRLLFAALMVGTAVALPFQVARLAAPAAPDVGEVVLLVALGLLAGTMGGVLGVGGGIVMVPGLVLLLSVSLPVAKGTSLVVIVPTALVGTIRNLRAGNTDLRVAAVTGAAGVASAFGASLLAVRLDPLLSAALFGALLVAMAARLLLAARGRPVPGDPTP
ncbi:MAG: sulfite exporter TauE/SafE family protein [Actinomycetota bacterium]